ncbi:MAG TPA: hypothetical protein VNG71_14455, partial [Pyrinomonadaceae bacterium]|nr:hypothetical protein [Pyrinomonadaceae bacterium]
RKVVNETVKYPNVVYEIMNEPFGGGQTKEDNLPMRVKWNDTMLGVIYEITQGKRLIFYNELQPGDIAAWKHSTDVTKSTLNYHHLDGVTFHVDARNFDPKTRLTSDLLSELVVQVSTDTVDEHLREDGPYNQAATTHAFANHMMFQAEALSNAAAQGIGSASPPPTLFNLPDFIGRWWKLPEWSTPNFFPHLAHVVNDDATIVDLNQDTDQFTMQGRVVSIGPGTLTSFNQLSGKLATFDIEFPEPERMQPPVPLPNVTLLQFFRDNIVQVFRKLEPARDLLYPFYFKWERISVVPADSPIQPFYMFIYPDRKLVTHNKADFVKNSDAIIKEISPDQIVIFNNTNQKRNVWNYTFSNQNQQLTIVRVLVNKDDTPLTQTFRRLL